jgi:hypothetical protein
MQASPRLPAARPVQPFRDLDLLEPGGEVGPRGITATAISEPGPVVELEPAVEAVTGVGLPVARRFAVGERVPVEAEGAGSRLAGAGFPLSQLSAQPADHPAAQVPLPAQDLDAFPQSDDLQVAPVDFRDRLLGLSGVPGLGRERHRDGGEDDGCGGQLGSHQAILSSIWMLRAIRIRPTPR